MKKLINWVAKRAGGRITINGVDAATQKPFKVVGVDTIEAGLTSTNGKVHGKPIATDKNGDKYELA